MEKKIVDARGLACPLPVVNAKKAIEELTGDGEVSVFVDNSIAAQNLLKFAKQRGYEAEGKQNGEKDYEVMIKVNACEVCNPNQEEEGLVVVLSGNVMGTGDEKLGMALMKAFVFALTKQEVLPETILCYNTGAYLTCEGADTLEDMHVLEAEGVKILTCGTCLDFYGIKEKLAVGSVTNMYEIAETMEKAKKLVRP